MEEIAINTPPPGSPGHSNGNNGHWHCFGKKLPKSEIVFFCQILLVYITVIVALVNLTLYREDHKSNQIWIALLASCVGYILPNPKIKPNGHHFS